MVIDEIFHIMQVLAPFPYIFMRNLFIFLIFMSLPFFESAVFKTMLLTYPRSEFLFGIVLSLKIADSSVHSNIRFEDKTV